MIGSAEIEVPDLSVYDVLRTTAGAHSHNIAYEYLGHAVTYKEFLEYVDDLSLHFRKMGIREGDRVTISLPNCPQALVSFYALNRIGAISVMVHPLSSKNEIEFYIKDSGSKMAITLGKFCDNFPKIGSIEGFQTLIVTSPVDTMPFIVGKLMQARYKDSRTPKVRLGSGTVPWKKMMRDDVDHVSKDMPEVTADMPASILYTGGTTGWNKGAVHSSRSFNAAAYGMVELSGLLGEGDTMLAELPMFHGFGLCTCVHLPICIGLRIILVPTFTIDSLCKTIVNKRINFIAGVPTLYKKFVDNEHLSNTDLSFLKGLFCGGDFMSMEAKERVDSFLAEHGCTTKIRIGYGCTESLSATAITPKNGERPGSVGVPIPGLDYKIVRIDTVDEVSDGEEGEICMCGPSVMRGYHNNTAETENVLKLHDDGRTWLHTGDVGCIEDGCIYFRYRIKRLIITSGYNVYPNQIEEVLNRHPLIDSSCVIGIPDNLRGSRVRAVIVLKKGAEATQDIQKSIMAFVKDNISAYAKPREYAFVKSLPMTKLGKVDYRCLEESAASESGTDQSSSSRM